ncbi:MAG TPA: hypothetical protein VMT89_15230 [Candidatus Acidoferrales bacterium]|nr:hypothetical protein [Candidatus Acidoferrales bacterium]
MNDQKPVRWQVRVLAVVVVVVFIVAIDWFAGFLTYSLGDYRESNHNVFRVNADPTGYRRWDPDYHHGLTPKHAATDTWGKVEYSVATNSLGFKDATTRDVPLEWNGPRLMFIGDSFTEGLGYPYEQTWAGLVDKALSTQGVAVLNGGVASYCPKTAYYKTKALLDSGLQLTHVVFFIDVSDMADEMIFNDFMPAHKDADDTWSGRYVKTRKRPALFQFSLVYRSLLKRWDQDPWRRTLLTDPATGRSFVFDNEERENWTRGDEPEWLPAAEASATFYVDKLAALCAAHGIELEIAIYPWPLEIELNETHSRYRNFWLKFCADRQIGCYDLHDIFFRSDPAARQQLLVQDFIPKDVHWSAAGHAAVADEWLRQYRRRHANPAAASQG